MGQTYQDDHFNMLAIFAECVYFNLVLVAMKRPLSIDEMHILQRATEIAASLHLRAGEAWPDVQSQHHAR